MKRSEFSRAAVAAAIGAWIGFVVGPNAMIAATNSNFLSVLPEALHTSRTAISSALAISLWLVAALVPFAGRVMDRLGVRTVIVPGVAFFGIIFLALGRMETLWQFVLLQIVMSVAVAMHGSVGYAKVISLWFDRNRGLVLGLCVALGAGVSQTLMPKISRWLIDSYGWRGGYTGIALIVLVIGFPLIFLLLRTPAKPQTPASEEVSSDPTDIAEPTILPEPPQPQGLVLSEIVRQPVFYLVVFGIMFGSMALLGTMQHAVPMITERGLPIGTATTVMSCAFGGLVLGEFSSGILVDRFNTPRVVLPYFMIALAGVLIVHTAADPAILLPGAVLMGLGLGGEVGQNAYLVSRYFGLRSFGTVYGITYAASAVGNGTGLILLGYIRDHFGTYAPGRYLVGSAMTASVLCIALLPKFRFASPRAGNERRSNLGLRRRVGVHTDEQIAEAP